MPTASGRGPTLTDWCGGMGPMRPASVLRWRVRREHGRPRAHRRSGRPRLLPVWSKATPVWRGQCPKSLLERRTLCGWVRGCPRTLLPAPRLRTGRGEPQGQSLERQAPAGRGAPSRPGKAHVEARERRGQSPPASPGRGPPRRNGPRSCAAPLPGGGPRSGRAAHGKGRAYCGRVSREALNGRSTDTGAGVCGRFCGDRVELANSNDTLPGAEVHGAGDHGERP